ncbi:hypothetical protein C8250_009335 [Streptomyces sp. So13.3]|uniref:hypothetical protein n=1 Tax=Streptomyces sp. So13.3 TaxID=2136173 RepID=UPI0011072106|nr:hypothetical protein [Streptomyces sp. So13.3]QNA72081.1 hypothetical protein C8250_009335 [Streptomyces sp. So13.3]
MASRKPPSTADQQLVEHALRHDATVTVKQLAGWRRTGLLLGNTPGGGLGRGRGSTSTPPPQSFELVVALGRLAGRGKRPADLALLLFAEGVPVPEPAIRSAFRAAVDTGALPGEDDAPHDSVDLDERLNRLSNGLLDSGQTITLVPARVRRIDERIARSLGELPAEIVEMDRNDEPSRLTPQDATLTAVTAALGGSIPIQDIGGLLRAMSPGMPAHPFASLIETTQEDAPEVADLVLSDDGSLSFIPNGDFRGLLRVLADTAPLEDLAAGWRTATQVREWALDLCRRVERELDSGQLGEAVTEWLHGRQLLSGLSVVETLRDRRWSPSKGAFSALMLLFQCQMFVMLDGLVPGCQWHVLQMPGVLPPPIRDLVLSKIGQEAAVAGESASGT